jgi:metal-responsive CopG/Arc/MetJ family transcriptional regulator
MSSARKIVRQSVSLPHHLATKVRSLAKHERTSTNRVLVELIETGIDSKEAERRRFFELADRLGAAPDLGERKRIKKELARLTFGE